MVGSLIYRVFDWFIDVLIGLLIGSLICWSVCLLVHRFVCVCNIYIHYIHTIQYGRISYPKKKMWQTWDNQSFCRDTWIIGVRILQKSISMLKINGCHSQWFLWGWLFMFLDREATWVCPLDIGQKLLPKKKTPFSFLWISQFTKTSMASGIAKFAGRYPSYGSSRTTKLVTPYSLEVWPIWHILIWKILFSAEFG